MSKDIDIETHDTAEHDAKHAEVYGHNERVKVAELCGRELMYADSPKNPWDWNDVLNDPERLHDVIGKMWLIIGKTETGKSYWIREFCYHTRNIFTLVIVMSHTKFNGFYQQFLPNGLIVGRFDPEVCQALLNLQKSRWGRRGHNDYILLVLDDIASENLQHQNLAQQIAMEGRHYGISTLFSKLYYFFYINSHNTQII